MAAPRPIQADGKLHGVVGAIHRAADDRWLCIRRSQHVAAPGKVCFPGGAIEIGEDHADALVREMREELGVVVRPIRQCWRWEAPDRPLVLFGWTAELVAEELRPDPMEIAEVLWLTAEEVAGHPEGLPSNRAFVACLLEKNKAGSAD